MNPSITTYIIHKKIYKLSNGSTQINGSTQMTVIETPPIQLQSQYDYLNR